MDNSTYHIKHLVLRINTCHLHHSRLRLIDSRSTVERRNQSVEHQGHHDEACMHFSSSMMLTWKCRYDYETCSALTRLTLLLVTKPPSSFNIPFFFKTKEFKSYSLGGWNSKISYRGWHISEN
jgi:hypothetical protein